METEQNTKRRQMRAVQYEAGGPEKMSIGIVPVPELKDKQVLVKVIASSVNRADTVQRKGNYPPPPGESDILGLDAAGVVESLGPGCTPGKWKPGDRVMALLSGGGNAEYVAVYEGQLISIPESLPFVKAAAIPEAWLTAFQLLKFVGKVQADDFVLVHAGGSGVGTAAIQLAKLFGAKPMATAGTQEKLDMAIELGAVCALNYKEENIVPRIMEFTGGHGADLILDCVAGSFSQQNCECIARDGHWVIYGTMGGINAPDAFLRQILMKRITLVGSTLRTRTNQYKDNLVRAFSEQVVPHFGSSGLRLIIDQVYPLGQIGAAHEHMELNKNTGKIVIQVRNEEEPLDVKEDL